MTLEEEVKVNVYVQSAMFNLQLPQWSIMHPLKIVMEDYLTFRNVYFKVPSYANHTEMINKMQKEKIDTT